VARDHLVVGPEGSGTTLFTEVLRGHPGAGRINHCPYPTWRPHYFLPDGSSGYHSLEETYGEKAVGMWSPARCGDYQAGFMDLNGIDPDGEMMVWVMSRDKSCTTLSGLRRRHFNNKYSNDDLSCFGRDVELKRLWIEEQLTHRSGPTVFVSYETLMLWGDFYLRRIFSEGGLDPDDYNYDRLDLRDGNAKWIRDP
jgi:hypothetical protein